MAVNQIAGHWAREPIPLSAKLLWLATCNIQDKCANEREKERHNHQPANPKKSTAGKLVQGAATTNWKLALAQLPLAYRE